MATTNNDFETNLLEIFWAICNFMEPTDVSNTPSSSTNCHKLSMSRKINCQPDNSPQNSEARELGLIPTVKKFPQQDYQRRTFTELGSSSINNRVAVQHILPSVNQYVISPFTNFTVEPSTSGMNIDKNLVFQKKRFNKRRTRRSLDLSNNANIYNLNEDLQDIEVTLTSLKAIDVGPLCSTKTNLTSLLIKFNTLYRYILLLQNERNQVETLLNVNINEKYVIPPIHGIRSHIEFARKSISFELSKMLAVFKLDHFRIDDEMMEHVKNLLNNLNVEMLKLNIFENINCFQRNRECIKPDDIDCKIRWKSLRDLFQRKKHENKKSSGSAESSSKLDHRYESLLFLHAMTEERETISSAPIESTVPNISIETNRSSEHNEEEEECFDFDENEELEYEHSQCQFHQEDTGKIDKSKSKMVEKSTCKQKRDIYKDIIKGRDERLGSMKK